MTDWRCFVAIPIGAELRQALARAVDGWKAAPPGDRLRWTDPETWHVTLAFLGSTEPDRVPDIERSLVEVARGARAVECPTDGVGAFPSPNAARVVVYRVTDPDGSLGALALAVRRALGVEHGGRFRPHVTLARTRGDGHERLGEWVRTLRAPSGLLAADRVELFRSHLGGGPARYESLSSIRLPKDEPIRA